MREIKTDLSDTKIEAASDFVEKGQTFIYRDFGGPSSVTGLRARVGQHRVTLYFHHDDRTHGQRKITSKRLGHWPATTIKEARGMARIEAGRIAAGNGEPGKRAAVKFEEAFADYVAYLERKADANGKPRRWARNVAQLGRQLLLPQWGGWSLADMSTQPGAIAKWHREATRAAGPVSANHAARVLRAAYRRAARLDLRHLSNHGSAVAPRCRPRPRIHATGPQFAPRPIRGAVPG